MIEIAIKAIASYLLGSVMGSLVVGHLRGGVDIRKLGSGNAGGTNALRTQGKAFAIWVMLIDIAKGFIATRLIASWQMPGASSVIPLGREWLVVICGMAVIIGHVYPIWYEFKGGKGVATLLGAIIGLDVWLLLPMLITWLVVVFVSGYVGLASIAAAFALPIYLISNGAAVAASEVVFTSAIAAVVLFTHRANIARMSAGREPRARKLWLLGRRRA